MIRTLVAIIRITRSASEASSTALKKTTSPLGPRRILPSCRQTLSFSTLQLTTAHLPQPMTQTL